MLQSISLSSTLGLGRVSPVFPTGVSARETDGDDERLTCYLGRFAACRRACECEQVFWIARKVGMQG